jgi:hypothetical protein
MRRRAESKAEPKRTWFREYVVGLGLGGASTVYGLFALWTQHSFLPGLKGGSPMLTGLHSAAIAAVYISGGLYLVVRFYVHERLRKPAGRRRAYLAENFLLIMLISALAYVLWQVGTVG